MYIRCLDCQSSTWIESVEPGSKAQGVSCRTCGREYALEVPADLGATQRDQYQKALSFAEGQGIDLPSAYSVLLGIMSVDEARGLREKAVSDTTKAAAARIAARKARARKKAPDPAAARQAVPGKPEPPPYDPGFRRAVRDGTLTAAQATERGNRKRMATRLARANGLSRRLAFEVADNRISLPDALSRQEEQKASLKGPRRVRLTQRQRSWITGVLSVAFMLLAVNGVCLWHGYAEEAEAAQGLTEAVARHATVVPESAPEPDRPSRSVDPTTVQTDDEGRVLAIAGPNPREVLIRYCQAASLETRLEPVELTSAVPPFPGTRLGLFREHGKLGSLFAIRIRREARSHRWVAGDGSRPIAAFRAPPLPPDAQRIAISLP